MVVATKCELETCTAEVSSGLPCSSPAGPRRPRFSFFLCNCQRTRRTAPFSPIQNDRQHPRNSRVRYRDLSREARGRNSLPRRGTAALVGGGVIGPAPQTCQRIFRIDDAGSTSTRSPPGPAALATSGSRHCRGPPTGLRMPRGSSDSGGPRGGRCRRGSRSGAASGRRTGRPSDCRPRTHAMPRPATWSRIAPAAEANGAGATCIAPGQSLGERRLRDRHDAPGRPAVHFAPRSDVRSPSAEEGAAGPFQPCTPATAPRRLTSRREPARAGPATPRHVHATSTPATGRCARRACRPRRCRAAPGRRPGRRERGRSRRRPPSR